MESLTAINGPTGVAFVVLLAATVLAAVAMVVCAIAALIERVRFGRRSTAAVTRLTPGNEFDVVADVTIPHLPVGAETALNAITEVRPDPRNVVVTHRDPTGEVRVRPYPRSA